MKRSLVSELLEHLLVCCSSLMVSAIFVPYGQSLGRSLRRIRQQVESCPHDFSLHSHQTVSATLSQLKKRGLVASRGPKKKAVWFITTKGKFHFRDLKECDKILPEDGKTRLVIYDIPEEMSTQRVWLRNQLSAHEYICLQKSVWLGTRPLSVKLRNEFKERGILSCIHIVGLEGPASEFKRG